MKPVDRLTIALALFGRETSFFKQNRLVIASHDAPFFR
jgi:hypothetical protein